MILSKVSMDIHSCSRHVCLAGQDAAVGSFLFYFNWKQRDGFGSFLYEETWLCVGRQAASFHYRRCSRASHVQYIQYVILPGRFSRQRRHDIHLQYCVYTVYILYIHGALARQMKMFWNRNASSQLCEQYITHVYVQYIYSMYIRCACAN